MITSPSDLTPPNPPMAPAPPPRSGTSCCSRRLVLALLLLSAVPLASIVALERRATSAPSAFSYRSLGWLRECAKWDAPARRFLVSTVFEAGLSEVPVPGDGLPLQERRLLREADVAGNASLGIAVDRARGRVLVVYADVVGHRYGAVGAYDLASWERLFLTQLSGAGDGDSMADDVAVDPHGNAYITDARANKIWKVDPQGQILSIMRSKGLKPRPEWYFNYVGLNGIVFHPNGYLLVIHTTLGSLLKVDVATEEVKEVRVSGGSLLMGDGLVLVSPSRLVVAGSLSNLAVESEDEWLTARVRGRYLGAVHRVATSATVVEGKVYVSHLVGGGLRERRHIMTEAVFLP